MRRSLTAALLAACALLPSAGGAQNISALDLGRLDPPPEADAARAELGRMLFFDTRLSGDDSLSCATCHAPDTGWTTRLPMSEGYTGTPHFRNAPSLLNVSRRETLHWDARLDGSDLGTASRDGIVEAHFMNADSRLVQERLKQVPEYLEMFQAAYGDEPYGGRIYGALAEFMATLHTSGAPYQAHLDGAEGALSEEALRGLELFGGKAGCAACHSGGSFSDGAVHATGVPDHPELATDADRQITMLRYYSSFGVPNYMNRRSDIGFEAVSKDAADRGKFATPSLWDVGRTGPYMHSGVFETLGEVVDFYDRGGGETPNKSELIRPLGLTRAERAALVAFLESLTGEGADVAVPERPAYGARAPQVAQQ
jgi:cytochrome c peroxidase